VSKPQLKRRNGKWCRTDRDNVVLVPILYLVPTTFSSVIASHLSSRKDILFSLRVSFDIFKERREYIRVCVEKHTIIHDFRSSSHHKETENTWMISTLVQGNGAELAQIYFYYDHRLFLTLFCMHTPLTSDKMEYFLVLKRFLLSLHLGCNIWQ